MHFESEKNEYVVIDLAAMKPAREQLLTATSKHRLWSVCVMLISSVARHEAGIHKMKERRQSRPT